MPTLRFPVLIWQDPAGGFTAVAVDEADLAGFGPSAARACQDLRGYLEYAYAQDPDRPGPDFHEPELEVYKVSVRPEYRTPQRVHPCEQPVTLRVHCVRGRQEGGQPVAALPLLGIRFAYHEPAALKGLVQRYVQQELEGATPAAVARRLAPPEVTLADVAVRVPKGKGGVAGRRAPRVLPAVAEPLGGRAVRKQYARAWERDAEVTLLVRKLHAERANVLLVGEPGCGKTTVLVEAVRQIEDRLMEEAAKAGEAQQPRRFWLTGGGRLIAGMQY